MSISYPLVAPITPRPAALSIRAVAIVGMSRSPFTNEQEVHEYQGDYFEMDVQLPAMKRPAAEEWIGMFMALNGRAGTVVFGIQTKPRGIATGTPLVNGASQTGKTLQTDGWTATQTGILKIGDWFQLGTGANVHLHKVVQDANSNGSGEASLEIWPRLRASPSDNAPLTLVNPLGIWRLSENHLQFDIGRAEMYGLQFTLTEAM